VFVKLPANVRGVHRRWSTWRRLFNEERGQDLVEYALLTAAIGLSALAVFALVAANGPLFRTYSSWDSGQQALWEVPDPQG
jgi:hypothetical protein